MSSQRKKFVLPFVVTGVGVLVAVLFAGAREAPERRQPPELAPLVEVVEVHHESQPAIVLGQGTLRPRHVVELVPQVAGKVIEVHPSLVGGGIFAEGELLVQVDPRDFELAVRRNEAELARAEVALETERAEAEIARDEWGRLHPGEEPSSPLVVREPQVRQKEAELAAARANVDRARLDLERTTLRAPFDGRVESERVEVGQFLVVGQSVATLYATRRLEVPLPLEDRQLEWFAVGDSAEVAVRFGGARRSWEGSVVRIEGVDPATRMVTVVVEIEDGRTGDDAGIGLLPGMFAEVAISGRLLDGIPIPRSLLRSDDQVWVLEDEGVLRTRDVQVARADRERAFVVGGLAPGDRLVATTLEAVTDGMSVRVAEPRPQEASS